MSLKAMADTVRAEHQRALAAAPAARRKASQYQTERWTEVKRRAWEKSRPIFEAAFRRQFSPDRFTYENLPRTEGKAIKVSINYEGKLLAYCHVYIYEQRAPWLRVMPLDESSPGETLQVDNDALYKALAKLVEKWKLA